jgi:hypothetical protein
LEIHKNLDGCLQFQSSKLLACIIRLNIAREN